ncbi:DinB family protein [Lysobacter sp. M2-1]|jgi:uncharacterized damage-inducible protein DinB|uniref:DinB family protein n=1 Tax=Lysobacter sp. M2-1 TaxID=2916839 RepID=UPI001F56FD90|nr:DinB family protein [Lysobacter sp. M2-1]
MSCIPYVTTMAAYNAWMNEKVYTATARLPEDEVMRERGAFFGSIFGTLSHLVVADTVWLRRFATDPMHADALAPVRAMPAPARLDERPCADLAALARRRSELDAVLVAWTDGLTDAALRGTLRYADMRGNPHARDVFALLMHLFNHQTHHRGQATTLLSQAGQDVGVTDLVAMPTH